MKAAKVLKILQITRQTLTKYVKTEKIRIVVKPNGDYDYNDDDVYSLAGISSQRRTVVYARVSTTKQKKDLENQISVLTEFANKNGYKVDEVYSDIASGLKFDRKNFQILLHGIMKNEIKTVVIRDKDRLSRVSFDMWKNLFEHFNCELVVMNNVQKNISEEQEIFEDNISLVHCFAMRMYSSRRKKKIALVEEDLKNELEEL